jgi:AmmeMemoRadiSam system protein A
MELSRSPETAGLSADERAALAALARGALSAAVRGERLPGEAPSLSERLRAPGASFVTLHRRGELRGCIGTLRPLRSLSEDVASNARTAALDDRRFDAVEPGELGEIEIEVSVLSAVEPLAISSREELLALLRPGVDGLVLDDGAHRATFLPTVWEQLPEPEEFLSHLERKAGLRKGSWSPSARFGRYTVETFSAGRAVQSD